MPVFGLSNCTTNGVIAETKKNMKERDLKGEIRSLFGRYTEKDSRDQDQTSGHPGNVVSWKEEMSLLRRRD